MRRDPAFFRSLGPAERVVRRERVQVVVGSISDSEKLKLVILGFLCFLASLMLLEASLMVPDGD